MGVPYSVFCCEINKLKDLIASPGGGATYTAGSGLQLVGDEFSIDESYTATIAYVDSAIASAATPIGVSLALISGNYLN